MDTQLQSKGNAGDNSGNDRDKVIVLVFIVNTTPTKVKVVVDEPLKVAAKRALEQTHNTGRPLDDYELKLGDKVLDMNKSAKDYHLKEGTELFLSLKAGTGGSR
jgi:hypothetical protein